MEKCSYPTMETNKQNQPPNERKRQKREADGSILLSDDDLPSSFLTFLVVETADGQPIRTSIFGIQKLIKCAVGDVKTATKLRNGTVLIEVASSSQAERVLAIKQWIDIPVKVTPHGP